MNGWKLVSIVVAASALHSPADAEPPATETQESRVPGDQEAGEVVRKALQAHNRERAGEKLAPLSLDPKLTAAAQAHAKDMAEHGTMSHEGSDGSTPFDRIKREGYLYKSAGENVAEGQRTVEGVMKAWMNSPHHRENILGKFTQVGIGVARDEDGNPFWSVAFGTPWPKLDPARAAADLVDAINPRREAADRPPLRTNPKLTEAASRIAEDLARGDSLKPAKEHGDTLARSLRQSGYSYRKLAESAASGQPGPEDVVKTWMDSPPHRANILGDFTEIGVGYATSPSGKPYWCVVLAVPLAE